MQKKKTSYDIDLVNQLIEADLEYGYDIDEIVLEIWKELRHTRYEPSFATDEEEKQFKKERQIKIDALLDDIQPRYPTLYNKTSQMIRHEVGYKYAGQNFSGCQTLGYGGYTGLYIFKKKLIQEETDSKETDLNPKVLNQLIEADLESGANLDKIIQRSWKELSAVENGCWLDELQTKYPTQYIEASKYAKQFIASYAGGAKDFTKMYLKSLYNSKQEIDYTTCLRFIEFDLKNGSDVDDLLSGLLSEKLLFMPDFIEKIAFPDDHLLDKIQEKYPTPNNRAIKILRHELGYYQGNFDLLNQQGYT